MKINFLSNVKAPSNHTVLTVADAVGQIQTGVYKAQIESVRAVYAQDGNCSQYKQLKQKLPAYTFNGVFDGPVKNENFKETSRLFHFDIDHVEPEEMKEKLQAIFDKSLSLAFTSPSGKGVKGAVCVGPNLIKSDADFKRAFAFFDALLKEHGITIDSSCNDVRRLCYVSHDEQIFYNARPKPYPVKLPEPEPEPVREQIPQTDYIATHQDAGFCEKNIRDMFAHAVPGNRHEIRLKAGMLVGGYVAAGRITQAEAMAILTQESDRVSDKGKTSRSEFKTLVDAFNEGFKSPALKTPFEPSYTPNNHNGAKLADDLLKSHTQAQNKPNEPQNEQGNTSQPQTEKTSKTGFSFVSADQLTLQPKPVKWLIKNYIEQDSLNLLFGEPGSGKSLLSLEWAFCITNGISWNGQPVQPGKVAYICGEGFSGLGKRLKALEQKYDMPVSENLLISKAQMDLVNAVSAAGVADAIKAAGGVDLIVVDTLHRNMLADENSSSDMAKVISNIDNHLKINGEAVLIVHHTGHGAKDRSRGSSSIRASMDAEFSLSKDDKQITLSCTKSKDFEPPQPTYFEQTTTTLDGWADDEGQPLTSALLQASDTSVQTLTKSKRMTLNQQTCFDALGVVLEQHGKEAPPELLKELGNAFQPGLRICHVDLYRTECYKRINVKPNEDKHKEQNSRYRSWQRVIADLQKRGLIRIYDNFVFYIHEPVVDKKLEAFYEMLNEKNPY